MGRILFFLVLICFSLVELNWVILDIFGRLLGCSFVRSFEEYMKSIYIRIDMELVLLYSMLMVFLCYKIYICYGSLIELVFYGICIFSKKKIYIYFIKLDVF